MKWFSVFFMLLMMTGCLTGRSWDTPGEEAVQKSLPMLPRLTIYIDGEINLMRHAIGETPQHKIELKDAEKKDNQYIAYPVIKVKIRKPVWIDNWFTVPSSILSGFTISMIPGYMYQASEVAFQLILPDKSGNLTTTDFTYIAKRHYVSWLPLWVVGNFTQTVQVFTEPKVDWDAGYRRIIRQFFRDANSRLEEYDA